MMSAPPSALDTHELGELISFSLSLSLLALTSAMVTRREPLAEIRLLHGWIPRRRLWLGAQSFGLQSAMSL